MECIRCQGLMVGEQFFDFEGTQGFMWMKGWRCMNCGHAADPVIEANHRLHDATVRVRPSEELEKEHELMYRLAEPVTRGCRMTIRVRSTRTYTKGFPPDTDSQEGL